MIPNPFAAPLPLRPPVGNPFAAASSAPPATPLGVAAPLSGNAVTGPVTAAVPSLVDPDAAMTTADLTEEYISLRNKKKVIADRHAEELAPFTDRMAVIEAKMLARLDASGVESVRTTKGTAFKKISTSYNVEDAETLFGWIEAHSRLDMVARSIKQDAMREYAEETKTLPPGVGVFSRVVVQFRK